MARAIAAIVLTMTGTPHFATANDHADASGLYVSPHGSDEGDGTRKAPFRTIPAASRAAGAGTTIHVAPGRYPGGFITTASGTASAPITYVSDVPDGAKIVGAGTAETPNQAGWENRGNNIMVAGFDIDGSSPDASGWAYGFYNAGSYVTFRANTVHDIMTDPHAFVRLTAGRNGGAGVMMDGYYHGTQGSVINNVIHTIGPSGWRSFLVHGIYQSETGSIANNVVYDVVGAGIHLWHGAHHISIIHNTIDGAAGSAGILVGSGDSGSSPTTGDYITVIGNIVTNSAAGIEEEGITGVHNKYIDNLLYNNMDIGIRLQNNLVARGTVIADPLFFDRAHRDYRVRDTSPAVGPTRTIGASGTALRPRPKTGE
ncbi:MAG TPA: right-handed parallel beta-helix repeat-containing protein [Acetobacteraceae bacterium]|nr:right-handed parallel beta-helix repeat-containing protein [Acetobacteraceae bacterium]